MSTSPAENPVPGVVTFTARGNAALDHLAASLVTECDGSPASIAQVLEQVLEADIEHLANDLSETDRPPVRDRPASHDTPEAGPAVESPDESARRRLGERPPFAGGPPEPRSISR